MVKENESVVSYLEENHEELYAYFFECKEGNKLPNYSEFCRKYLNGESSDGVAFNSIKIKRRQLTEFIRTQYKLWMELN